MKITRITCQIFVLFAGLSSLLWVFPSAEASESRPPQKDAPAQMSQDFALCRGVAVQTLRRLAGQTPMIESCLDTHLRSPNRICRLAVVCREECCGTARAESACMERLFLIERQTPSESCQRCLTNGLVRIAFDMAPNQLATIDACVCKFIPNRPGCAER